jgi:hypothetical protein
MSGEPEYVAIAPIDFGNARAFNPGDPVPAANVKAHGYVVGEQVAKVGTRAAEKAVEPDPEPSA